jgi:hypothetical protein
MRSAFTTQGAAPLAATEFQIISRKGAKAQRGKEKNPSPNLAPLRLGERNIRKN